jgi:cyclic pyranopterin phosphate synthase
VAAVPTFHAPTLSPPTLRSPKVRPPTHPIRRPRRRAPAMTQLTHVDETGASRMVDVGAKPITRRTARASAAVRMQPATLAAIAAGPLAKGSVQETARLAGIMAAKRTAELVPLCHPLALDVVDVALHAVGQDVLAIEATAVATARTGVEMEALTAASVAALTVYDMCKAIDRGMTIERIQLEEKTGGVRGDYYRDETHREGTRREERSQE